MLQWIKCHYGILIEAIAVCLPLEGFKFFEGQKHFYTDFLWIVWKRYLHPYVDISDYGFNFESFFFFRTLSCISVVFMSDIWSGIAARCWDIQHLLSITTDSVRCSAVNWTNQHNWLRGISIALFKSVFSKMSFMLDYKLKVSAVVQTLALLLWMYCY